MSLALTHGLDTACAWLAGNNTGTGEPAEFAPDGLRAWRICALREFWAYEPDALSHAQQMLAAGWWSTQTPWGFMLRGDGREVSAHFLLPGNAGDALTAEQLRGALPGAEVELGPDVSTLFHRVAPLPHAVALAGHPDVEAKLGLDPLLRALVQEPFAWIVFAQPAAESVITSELAWLDAEEQTVREEFLARPGITLDNNSQAEHYLRLLSSARERAFSARQEGGWQVRAILHTASRAGLDAGSALLRGAYGRGGGPPNLYGFNRQRLRAA